MITLITGHNTFEIEQDVRRRVREFQGDIARVDGSELDLKSLPDLLTSATLFAEKRLVIIKNLSENKAIWPDFYMWLPRLSDDIELVLVESKPDKRTVTYKELKKVATLVEYTVWTDRDESKAIEWTKKFAETTGVILNTKSVQTIVRRVGLDQWALSHAIEKLALIDNPTNEIVEDIIDTTPTENVFNLFDIAIRGDRERVLRMIHTLELTEDPYRVFGLLSSQAFQLSAIIVAEPSDSVSRDLGIHPYVASKLTLLAKGMTKQDARRIIGAFAKADDGMKISRADPWVLIEQALLSLS